jgi:hypothetical protein
MGCIFGWRVSLRCAVANIKAAAGEQRLMADLGASRARFPTADFLLRQDR